MSKNDTGLIESLERAGKAFAEFGLLIGKAATDETYKARHHRHRKILPTMATYKDRACTRHTQIDGEDCSGTGLAGFVFWSAIVIGGGLFGALAGWLLSYFCF